MIAMETALALLGILVVAGIGIGVLRGRRSELDRNLSGTPRTGMASPPRAPRPAAAELAARLAPATRTAIAQTISRGDKLSAIKQLREATGMGLKDAKDTVEEMMGQR